MKNRMILTVGIASAILFSGCTSNAVPEPKTPHAKKQEMINAINNLPSCMVYK